MTINLKDPSQEWYEMVLTDHYGEATDKVAELLTLTEEDENGCLVTPTAKPRKVRFKGGQDRAYRFIFCVENQLAAASHQIVRHLCHNRRCVNPGHLALGDRRDNYLDEVDRRASGVFRIAP